jgi:hypothetical protein
MRAKSFVSMLLAGFTLWQWQARRREHREQLARSKAKPVEVSTWEGEGGALPRTGPQLGPEPRQL